MAVPRLRIPHVIPFALLAGAALVPAGCGNGDGVNAYNVPKSTEPTAKPGPAAAGAGPYRILGGMFPAEEPRWFFKLAGPTDALTPFEGGFDALLASVSLPADGGPPDFTPPEGWTRGPGRGQFVAATLRTPDGKYEVTVTSSAGGVYGNLKRWATDPGQLGGKNFDTSDVPKVTKPIDAKGVKGLRADVRGPNNPAGKGGPMSGGKGGLPPNHP